MSKKKTVSYFLREKREIIDEKCLEKNYSLVRLLLIKILIIYQMFHICYALSHILFLLSWHHGSVHARKELCFTTLIHL